MRLLGVTNVQQLTTRLVSTQENLFQYGLTLVQIERVDWQPLLAKM